MTWQRAVAEEIVHDAVLRAHGRWDRIDPRGLPAPHGREPVPDLARPGGARPERVRCLGHPTRSIFPAG
jgi:hypothetical protein